MIIIIISNTITYAKVDAPNYDFKFKMLYPFFPKKDFSEVKKMYEKNGLISLGVAVGTGTGTGANENVVIYKVYLKHQTFRFPIFFHEYQGKIVDFFVSLPSYFLHDPFLQDLQKEFGIQSKYSTLNGTSIYIWNESKADRDIKFVYGSTCTITCFPLYFAGTIKDEKSKPPGYTSLLDMMSF
ncbi:MAG: hypothetical protein HQK51_14120 [Oligoflexia bacterium]|nr:hypothetical protein [Oligoflexia bacterium]